MKNVSSEIPCWIIYVVNKFARQHHKSLAYHTIKFLYSVSLALFYHKLIARKKKLLLYFFVSHLVPSIAIFCLHHHFINRVVFQCSYDVGHDEVARIIARHWRIEYQFFPIARTLICFINLFWARGGKWLIMSERKK